MVQYYKLPDSGDENYYTVGDDAELPSNAITLTHNDVVQMAKNWESLQHYDQDLVEGLESTQKPAPKIEFKGKK